MVYGNNDTSNGTPKRVYMTLSNPTAASAPDNTPAVGNITVPGSDVN